MMTRRLIVVILVAAAAVVLWRSVFVVDQSEVALLTRFGQLEPTGYGAGAHLKWPLDELHRFDTRLITRSYLGESFLSKDQKPLSVDFCLRWRLSDPAKLYAANGGDEEATAARMVEPVREQIRSALADASLTADVADGHAAEATLHSDTLRNVTQQLGVELVDVQLQHIELPSDELDAVYQRMQQSLNIRAGQVRSQGVADADKIRSDADRRRADILADATREAQHIRGEADATASATYAHAYSANPEFAAFTRSLAAYRSSLGKEGDILVISPEGEFFKYLHSASGR
jgi:membrane protease subunit HflC